MLTDQEFIKVIDQTPLVALDLIIKNSNDEILLGKRNNKPAQDYWFVPGGRILKNESFEKAFQRLCKAELNITLQWSLAKQFGCYEHMYSDNYLNKANISTHYVVLAFQITIPSALQIVDLSHQHSRQCWWTVDKLLASDTVHPNTKAYFTR